MRRSYSWRLTMLKPLWLRVSGGGFGANTSLTAGTNLVMALLGMGSGILSARLLGPRGRGELAAIQTWPSFIATIAMLGMIEATIYYSACEPERTSRYIGSGSAIALIASIPFMLCGYLAMPVLLAAQSHEVVSAARWYLWIAPIYALVALPTHSLRGTVISLRGTRCASRLIWYGLASSPWLGLCQSEARRV